MQGKMIEEMDTFDTGEFQMFRNQSKQITITFMENFNSESATAILYRILSLAIRF